MSAMSAAICGKIKFGREAQLPVTIQRDCDGQPEPAAPNAVCRRAFACWQRYKSLNGNGAVLPEKAVKSANSQVPRVCGA